ncbi:3,4-dihydroxy-2-butanone 4-phosphate synthase [Neokomagataea thailandica NBRC 106555]|uniref:Multifunctional fusion protein n=2 Tax=Neokomagataea TaxID=1223423 RepID=A0A4Y6V8S8_9PROT|nr:MULTISPECIES: 3,4-dihydroxy-2-butanone-4-phosphate synthase [Neokomagataea]QDH24887.1 3,4-dihydroxy-2-butanone-4-phosphate synthase [Neokomagataea tanensis]GBR51054.1 3,4-dihydroxy-2-butanone 4-phosphate synthase [Neokomagataea thailandica NBRC 106555]
MTPQLKAAIDAYRRGGMVVMVDDENRENEGDLVMAAQFATAEAINFMAREARGLICLPLEAEQADRLNLPPMVEKNRDPRGTAFTISIEAATGVTTGISAADRARTIVVAAHPDAVADDVISPGHIFPLRAHPQGVVARNGHTEGSIDLARLAGLQPAGVICEIMADDGSMMRLPELRRYAAKHGLPLISIAELQAWCRVNGRDAVPEATPVTTPVPPPAEAIASSALPSLFGGHDLRIHAFRAVDGVEHVALVKGDPTQGTPLVRLHSECVTGDALGSLRCDCGAQLREALERISASESGVLLYLRGHEGRGIGLANKIRAYTLQDQGMDTVDANEALGLPADAREWDAAADILRHLGVDKLRLLTNNPDKESNLVRFGFNVTARERLEIAANPFNRAYLSTKRTRMGHFLQEQTS